MLCVVPIKLQRRHNVKLFSYVTSLTFFVSSLAFAMGATRGGGGYTAAELAAYKAGLEKFIKQDLGQKVINLLDAISVEKIKDQKIKDVLDSMKKNNALKEDINELKEKMYDVQDNCINGKDEYAQARRKTSICFSLNSLTDKNKTLNLNSLVQLALHAHAHQFGWEISELGTTEHSHTISQELTPDVIASDIEIPKNDLAGVNTNSTSPEEPVTLYSTSLNSDRDGISYSEANQICEKLKLNYQMKYFYVYCIYHQKNWYETYVAIDTVLVGVGYNRWGEVNRKYFSEVPRYYTNEKQIYGLEVIGLGNFLTSPVVTLLDSRTYAGEEKYSLLFDSETDAKLFCGYMVFNNRKDITYTRSECAIRKDEKTKKYYFLIKTQNPLLSGSIIK